MTEETLTHIDLEQFTGTLEYHKFSILFSNVVLTDGAKYLAEKAGAYWLMDMIASHMPTYYKKTQDTFAVATLEKLAGSRTGAWMFHLEDGNDNVICKQRVEYSTFPLPSVKLYVARDDYIQDKPTFVIMLPSEY